MGTAAYWLWLQNAMGEGAHAQEMLAAFGTARAVWEATPTARAVSAVFTPRQLSAMRGGSPKDYAPLIRRCAANGWAILTPESRDYPPLLRAIINPPLALFCHGETEILHHPMPLGVVGTRNASYRSRKIANRLCVSLTGAGVLIVSGGALGVDSASHEGALAAQGKTVAVLGAGLDVPYLNENAPLRKRISENGVLVSEFPPGTTAKPRNFPIRNRIISGMSRGVLVIEAGERSGSLITAGFALEQGRDVFAVPGDIAESTNNGSNKLIREGAKPVFSAYDVLEDYALRFPGMVDLSRADTVLEHAPDYIPPQETPRKRRVRQSAAAREPGTAPTPYVPFADTPSAPKIAPAPAVCPEGCTPNARTVFGVLTCKPQGADELARACKMPVGEVMAALTELELFGAAKRAAGNRFLL
ncbi:MAG: DNA-processing protein DprA [Oscillospiraceae bacterium]|jgi:DNA processing protein|nr:DNA-processing protein DprA [Oscillospiraceae bacterium]